MSHFDLALRRADYYSDGQRYQGCILVKNGKIVEIVAPDAAVDAEQVIDVAGFVVLPGLIDTHTHFREPARPDKEDYYSGTRAAAAAGFTTICEMPTTFPPVDSTTVLEQRHKLASGRALTDYAFYGAASFANRKHLQELADTGICAFKTFLNYGAAGISKEACGYSVHDDGELYLLLQEVAKTGLRCCFHCENYAMIEHLEENAHAQGEEAYSFHYLTRPNVTEAQAVATVLQFAKATGAKVGICHISTAEACQFVRQAQKEGLDVTAEICYHYLFFDTDAIDTYGPYAKCNPPLRSKADVAALWEALADGTATVLGSDHAPHIKDEKEKGCTEGIWRAPSGIPTLEAFLPFMLTAINQGRLTFAQLSKYLAANAARLFGFYPQKGVIEIGSDGDFTIVDPRTLYQFSMSNMVSKARENATIFEGASCQGKLVYTICRGNILLADGKLTGALPSGQWVVNVRK